MHPSHLSSQLDSPNRPPLTHTAKPPTVATLPGVPRFRLWICIYVSKHDMKARIQQHLDRFDNTTSPTQSTQSIPPLQRPKQLGMLRCLPAASSPCPRTATRQAACRTHHSTIKYSNSELQPAGPSPITRPRGETGCCGTGGFPSLGGSRSSSQPCRDRRRLGSGTAGGGGRQVTYSVLGRYAACKTMEEVHVYAYAQCQCIHLFHTDVALLYSAPGGAWGSDGCCVLGECSSEKKGPKRGWKEGESRIY